VTLANAPELVVVVIIVLNIAQLSYLTPIVGGIGLAQVVEEEEVVAVEVEVVEVEEALQHLLIPVMEVVAPHQSLRMMIPHPR
jgi:hypothetical protein